MLGVLVWLALGGRSAGKRGIVLAILIASTYGITDEFHQSFVPQRTPDVFDWITDTIGASVGVLAAWYLAGVAEARKARALSGDAETRGDNAGGAPTAD